jgi:hypothetical protein
VVEGDDRVEHHEEGLGDVQVVLEGAGRLGLKVLDAVVRDVADGAAGQTGELERGDADDAVLAELCLEGAQRVADIFVAGACRQDFPGVCRGQRSVGPVL